jgi:hypothetical protein
MTDRVIPFDPAAHKVADVLLPWLVNGTLEGDELTFVQQHVQGCARCQREVVWLREVHAACVAGEALPGASNAFRKLRRQLENPSPGRPQLRSSWNRVGPWSRWVIAGQLAVIVALGSLWLTGTEGPAQYRTLGAATASAPTTGDLVVVFDPTTSESDLRRILRGAGARVVDGPTEANAYVLDVPAERRGLALQSLRAERAVVLVEPLVVGRTR